MCPGTIVHENLRSAVQPFSRALSGAQRWAGAGTACARPIDFFILRAYPGKSSSGRRRHCLRLPD